MIHERHANLKYKHGNRSFWRRGYYVDIARKNSKKIAKYTREQDKQDQIMDKITTKEWADPFKG